MTRLSASQKLGLSTVLLAAIAFRMVGITSGWLWFDELLSVNFSNNGLIETIITVARFDVHPPAYYMQLALWMMFGASDTYLRLNAVVWGILAVLCVYLIGWRLNGPKSAFAAAGLLAASPAAVFYSEQVRMYTFVMFFVLLSFWFLLRFLETGKSLTLAGMLASMIVVIYSHGVGLIMTSGVSAYAFASVVRRIANIKPINELSDVEQDQIIGAREELMLWASQVNPALNIRRDGTCTKEWVSTCLMASYAMMALLDAASGLLNACDNCKRLFVSSAGRARFCSTRCRKTALQREYRSRKA